MDVPKAVKDRIREYTSKIKNNPKLAQMYEKCYLSTIETALELCEDGTYFVLTGDIRAMWLRDSSAQITHYLPLAEEEEIAQIFEGVLRRQFIYMNWWRDVWTCRLYEREVI
mgnify:CR=1 FL=1